MGAPLHLQYQKEVDGLKRTQRNIAKKIQNCFVRKQSSMHDFLGCERGHIAGIPSHGHNH